MENLDENIPMMCFTKKPLIYSTFYFGGDDIIGFCENYLPDYLDLSKSFRELREKYRLEEDEEVRKSIADEHFKCKQEIITKANGKFGERHEFCRIWEELLKTLEIDNINESFLSIGSHNDKKSLFVDALVEKVLVMDGIEPVRAKYFPNYLESLKTLRELREKYASEENGEAGKLTYDYLETLKTLRELREKEIIENARKIFNYYNNLHAGWNDVLESIEWNTTKRLQIVDALGGVEVCKTIPIISIDKKKFDEYMRFGLSDIPEGDSIVQFEDPAGRKGVILKLKHKTTGELSVMWINQRYRETSVCIMNDGGGLWMGHGTVKPRNVDQIVEFLNNPGEYELCYKSQ